MTKSFKSGSGNLNFGNNDDEDSKTEDQSDAAELSEGREVFDKEQSSKETSGDKIKQATEERTQSATNENDESASAQAEDMSSEEYPYYIRRNKVGDERDKRIELHLRNSVASSEPGFRNDLADEFNVDEVAKTDAREAALLFAFRNPEEVANLMREEGYGVFD